jgi:hypothetical protein
VITEPEQPVIIPALEDTSEVALEPAATIFDPAELLM